MQSERERHSGNGAGSFLFLHTRFLTIWGNFKKGLVDMKQINLNFEKLKKSLNEIPENQQPIAIALYDELIFINKTLISLRTIIEKEGVLDLFQNGSQEYYREHPALKSYNTTLSRYSNIIKQLIEIIPSSEQASDELLDFIGGN